MKEKLYDYVPEGYEIKNVMKDLLERDDHCILELSVYLKKKPPRRRIFECISEEPRDPRKGEWVEDAYGGITEWGYGQEMNRAYKIFREVKE